MLPTAVSTHTFIYVFIILRFFLKITIYPINYVFIIICVKVGPFLLFFEVCITFIHKADVQVLCNIIFLYDFNIKTENKQRYRYYIIYNIIIVERTAIIFIDPTRTLLKCNIYRCSDT